MSPCAPAVTALKMGTIADRFQAQLEAIKKRSAVSDRKTAEHLNHCRQLIKELEEQIAAENT